MLLLLCSSAFAQKDFKKDADKHFRAEAFHSAIPLYKEAFANVKTKEEKAESLFLIAECYRRLQQFAEAEAWYTKAINLDYSDPVAYYHLGAILKAQGKYPEALEKFEKFRELKLDDKFVNAAIESCEMAVAWQDNPTRYEVNHEPLLNSESWDFATAFADKKHNQVVFSSRRDGSTGDKGDPNTGQNFADLWVSQKDNKGKWSTPVVLDEMINSSGNEGSPTFDKKRTTMYFTRCEAKKKEETTCFIMKSEKQGNAWAEPEKIVLGADTFNYGHPSLSPDNMYLFFASDLEGGYGGKDIWYLKYDRKTKDWGTPQNAGSEVNTPMDELYPHSREDGSLYFSSDGHVGMGGLDIFKAVSTGEDKWGKVENVMYPLNSSANDFAITFEGKEEKGFLSSDRPGTMGADDIWSFRLAPLKFTLAIYVKDKSNDKPITSAKIKLTGSDGSFAEGETDDQGFVKFDKKQDGSDFINPEVNYTIEVSKEKYLMAKGTETTVGVEKSTDFVHEYVLQPFVDDSGEKVAIRLPEVLYPLDKYYLTQQAKDSMLYLFNILEENKNLVIELRSHTDSRGSDKYNLRLSDNRAKSCVDYLVEKGIPADRMVAKGYGEKKLLLSDAEIAKYATKEEQEAAHQLNRRTEFVVLRDDYVYPDESGTEQQ